MLRKNVACGRAVSTPCGSIELLLGCCCLVSLVSVLGVSIVARLRSDPFACLLARSGLGTTPKSLLVSFIRHGRSPPDGPVANWTGRQAHQEPRREGITTYVSSSSKDDASRQATHNQINKAASRQSSAKTSKPARQHASRFGERHAGKYGNCKQPAGTPAKRASSAADAT